jgi:hypothetical protein
VIEPWISPSPDSAFPVHRRGGRSLRLFIAAGSQWRVGGMSGVPIGLDYAGVRAAAAAHGIPWTATRLADLRAMESAALTVFAQKSRR